MTLLAENERSAAPGPPVDDRPRRVTPSKAPTDVIFRGGVRSVAVFVLVTTGAIAVFLGYQLRPTFARYGTRFLTGSTFNPEFNKIGIAGALVGTAEVALVAIFVGFPLALLTALYISEYAPRWLRPTLVSAIDLMAAVPSIIFGLWGLLALMPRAKYVSRWISQHLSWIPFFKVNTDPNSAAWAQSQYVGSAFIAGLCVGMMIIPLACSVMRGVFVLTPIGEKEAAYALGATKWGMVRTVVLPFGRGGIIGGTMLGLGRALGETIAVLLIISTVNGIKFRILTNGTQTVSALIAGNFGEATGTQLAALIAAGFVLFVLTLGINTIAAIFVSRSRSGSGVE
jgi:phosphate transport system permease protein